MYFLIHLVILEEKRLERRLNVILMTIDAGKHVSYIIYLQLITQYATKLYKYQTFSFCVK